MINVLLRSRPNKLKAITYYFYMRFPIRKLKKLIEW